jgi:hypothetical protein
VSDLVRQLAALQASLQRANPMAHGSQPQFELPTEPEPMHDLAEEIAPAEAINMDVIRTNPFNENEGIVVPPKRPEKPKDLSYRIGSLQGTWKPRTKKK